MTGPIKFIIVADSQADVQIGIDLVSREVEQMTGIATFTVPALAASGAWQSRGEVAIDRAVGG